MFQKTEPLENLVDQFARFPGIGRKSAVRMAYQHDVQRLNSLFLELLYQSRPAVCVARIDKHVLSLVLQQGRVGLAGV